VVVVGQGGGPCGLAAVCVPHLPFALVFLGIGLGPQGHGRCVDAVVLYGTYTRSTSVHGTRRKGAARGSDTTDR
jgi:hypothetical protein